MKYFLMQVDKSCNNVPRLFDWYQVFMTNNIDMEKFGEIADSFLLELQANPDTIFTGLITHPVLLLHADIYGIFERYVPGLPGKRVTLADRLNNLSQLYYLTWLRTIDCLSDKSILSKDTTKYDKLVLDKEKIGRNEIFYPKGHQGTEPIISLDMAESALRRQARGIHLVELEVV